MDLDNEVYHLARLALTGREQDIGLFLRRLCRRLRTAGSDALAGRLELLLAESPTRSSPMRNAERVILPHDPDSRLDLMRHEYPAQLDSEPVWPETVAGVLRQIVGERRREAELLAQGLAPTRTALFTGPPGVGKTLAARWIARELNRPLLILDLAAVMSSLLGRTGANIRHVLDYSKGAPCVLLLDELDAIAKRRDDGSEIGELKRLVTVLLQEIDDWPTSGLLLAATNHPDLLDPAIWRRFDVITEFPMPTGSQVLQSVKAMLAPKQVTDALIRAAAVALEGQSFSDVEREVRRMCREAVIANESIDVCILRNLKTRFGVLPTARRAAVGAMLHTQAGLSLRQAAELVGVHRNTITNAAQTGTTGEEG